jgi:hypothetical protein
MSKGKKCFVIMPISDQDGYDKGHFTRVYNYLIIPACKKAGFEPIRADDEIKTNHIVIDIIKKILNSDIVICDLSAKNPNVMYELGIRQAFNKKTVLIKDYKTSRVFDIQGLRTIDYDENLRIDDVQEKINKISDTLIATNESSSDEVNSLLQLLAIKPATYPENYEISKESNLILDGLQDLSKRISKIEMNGKFNTNLSKLKYNVNGVEIETSEDIFDQSKNHKHLGTLAMVDNDGIYYHNLDGKMEYVSNSAKEYRNITPIPF